ncbi:MAG: GNAT family N-acetyltransferase [bacterium]
MIDGPRGAKPEELDEVCALAGKVFSWQMRENFPTLFCYDNLDNLRIIKTDNKIVSLIGVVVRDMIINGCRISVGNVGSVCTYNEYRNKGYAWMIFEDMMQKLLSDGVDMLLVSGYRSLYEKHGCTHVGNLRRYSLEGELNFPQTKIDIKKFNVDDLPRYSYIYRCEPVRFHRPYNDFYKLTTEAIKHRQNRSLYSIFDGDQMLAYIVIDKGKSEISFNEYAGSRQAIFESISLLKEEFNADKINISVPSHDYEFAHLLDSLGVKANYTSTSGTVSILNFERLCKKLTPLFEEIVGSDIIKRLKFKGITGTYTISLDNEEIKISDAHDIARLIFGKPLDKNITTELAMGGELKNILSKIFPISRPEYGLNYI